MTSIERLIEYIGQTSEPYEEGQSVPVIRNSDKQWPEYGKIEFNKVSLMYNQTYALNNLSFKINPGEKIGIIGRTGAGKTSIIKVLYRLSDYSGSIRIDGISAKDLKLRELRDKLSIIPVSE